MISHEHHNHTAAVESNLENVLLVENGFGLLAIMCNVIE
jgi:hypothetical protein